MGQVIAFESLLSAEQMERARSLSPDSVMPWLANGTEPPQLSRAMRSLTKQTRATYRSTLRRLDKWLDGRPLTDTLLADWCDTLHHQGKAPASAQMVVNAARFRAGALQTDNPAGNETRRALKMLTREGAGRGRGRARPLTGVQVESLIQRVETLGTAYAIRDAAIIAICFYSGLRISEAVSLNVDDLTITDADTDGLIRLRQSKSDQAGRGVPVAFPRNAVKRVVGWIEVAGISSGPVFRPFANAAEGGYRITGRRLGKAMAALNVKKRAASFGYKITSHSLRRSFAQFLDAKGFGTHSIMQAGRWKSSAMVARYCANQEVLRSKTLAAFDDLE